MGTIKRFSRAMVLASLMAVAVAFAAARKVFIYSADPSGEKDCGPDQPAPAASPSHLLDATPPAAVEWKQRGGTMNDASCLNRTAVYGVVRVRRAEDVREALRFARANRLKVSIAGVRHSMGGQAFAPNALVLDMTALNAMSLDADRRVLTVESGARWHDIQ